MFERGFKAWCERYSLQKRKEIGLGPADPLDARALAKNLGIRVWTADEVPGVSDKSRHILHDADGWSAVTLCVRTDRLIILNPSHSVGRQASDLMHELAHQILEHHASAVDVSDEGVLLLHTYDRKQESEADWLSACLLLPRDALVHIKRREADPLAAAAKYGVSHAMLKYRLDVSGVNYQFHR